MEEKGLSSREWRKEREQCRRGGRRRRGGGGGGGGGGRQSDGGLRRRREFRRGWVLERGGIRVCKAKPCWGLHYLVLKHLDLVGSMEIELTR